MEPEITTNESTQPVETRVEAVPSEVPAEVSSETVEASQEASVETATDEQTTVDNAEVSVEPIVIPDLVFEGHNITVTIPEEAIKMCQDKGFDAAELAKELYGSEGFSLSAETREKLDAAYGKFFVDSIIGGLRADQQRLISEYKAKEQEAFNAVSDIVGGEGGWGKLELFAATIPEEDIDNFNSAMQSGNAYLQRLAVKDLVERMNGAEQPAQPEQPKLNLIEGDVKNTNGPTALSKEEYFKIMRTPEYKQNPSYYDNLRRAGMAQGIQVALQKRVSTTAPTQYPYLVTAYALFSLDFKRLN